VELLFNLLWFSVSLLLVVLWKSAAQLGHAQVTWSTIIALALLLVLLFPVISMTDDLVARAAPLEDNHPVRRGSMPLLQLDHVASTLLEAGALAALLFLGIAFQATRLSRLFQPSYSKKQLKGFARTSGVRPPPSALFAA
jgi:hypothetical protein